MDYRSCQYDSNESTVLYSLLILEAELDKGQMDLGVQSNSYNRFLDQLQHINSRLRQQIIQQWFAVKSVKSQQVGHKLCGSYGSYYTWWTPCKQPVPQLLRSVSQSPRSVPSILDLLNHLHWTLKIWLDQIWTIKCTSSFAQTNWTI